MIINTRRLVIRPFSQDDIDDVYDLRSDPEVMEFIRNPQSFVEVESWVKLISSKWETESIGFAGIFDSKTDDLFGWCGLWRLSETGEIEVGYAISKRHWREGYASEAASAVLEYGFSVLKLERIVAVAKRENLGSIAVMKKIGMTFVKNGIFYGRDLVQYGITKEQYDRNRTLDNE